MDNTKYINSPQAQEADFVLSAAAKWQFPRENLPEIALLGRSNCGKSSLLNRLLGRKNLARVGGTPGRTRQINFFRITWFPNTDPFMLVDLPGYGYAKAPKKMVESWRDLIADYLNKNRNLKLALLLMDIRRDPQEEEQQILDWLTDLSCPILLVGTKVDKLSKNKLNHRLSLIKKVINVNPWPFSSFSGEGREGLIEIIGKTLKWPNRNE